MPQLPATAFSRGFASLSRVHVAATRLLVWFSFHSDCHSHSIQLIYSCFTLQYPQMLHFCPKELSHVQIWPQLHFSHPQLQIQSYSLSSFSPSFLCPTTFCVVLCILCQGSGTPAHSQLEFCKIFCFWRYIPLVYMERDALHVHLLFHHLGS